jgi:hypothetical protein
MAVTTDSITPRSTRGVVERQLPERAYWLSAALVVVAAAATALTLSIPDVLTGPAVTNGQARGTALVMLVVAVPLLVGALIATWRGSWRARFIWGGAVAYLLYNGILLSFLTPINDLFLLYIATLSLAIFTTIVFVAAAGDHEPAGHLARLPARPLALWVWFIVAVNTVLWLADIVPALLGDDPASLVAGTGVATSVLYIQDLAFWLPAMALAGWWLWQRKPLGILLTGSWLVFGVMEFWGIAVDQWFGHEADPASDLVSTSLIPGLIVLGLIGLIPVWFYLRPTARPS